MQNEIPSEYQGWWRIIETSQWDNNKLDILGAALISLTGYADRLRRMMLQDHLSPCGQLNQTNQSRIPRAIGKNGEDAGRFAGISIERELQKQSCCGR
jgi:hypothetical protein